VAPPPYARAVDHLFDQLRICDTLLRAAVRRKQLGDIRHWERDADLARLAEELAEHDRVSRARVEVSEIDHVPLERLRRVFRLSPTEVRVLVLLVGLEIDVSLRERVRGLMADHSRPHPDVGLLAELLYHGPEKARVPEELGADGVLLRCGLIHVDRISDVAFVLRRVRAVERVIELVHGKDVLDRELTRFVDLISPMPPADLVLDGPLFDELTGLVGAAIETARRGRATPGALAVGPRRLGPKDPPGGGRRQSRVLDHAHPRQGPAARRGQPAPARADALARGDPVARGGRPSTASISSGPRR
jgi:hypothetical protein